MKLKVQAQYLQPGDIVGSGETVSRIFIPSFMDKINKGKVGVTLYRDISTHTAVVSRNAYWGKYTEINIERPEKVMIDDGGVAYDEQDERRKDRVKAIMCKVDPDNCYTELFKLELAIYINIHLIENYNDGRSFERSKHSYHESLLKFII